MTEQSILTLEDPELGETPEAETPVDSIEQYLPPARPNRQQLRRYNRFERRMYAQAHPKPPPPAMRDLAVTRPLTLRVQPDDLMEPVDELILLGALRELSRQHPKIQIHYRTKREDLLRLLQGAWFLRGADSTARKPCDFTLEMGEPDPQQAAEAEKAIYDQGYAQDLEKARAIQAKWQELGVKDMQYPEPEYAFVPRWNRGSAYLWKLGDDLGLPVQVPGAVLPYGNIPAELRRNLKAELARAGTTRQPFFLYDFSGEANPLPLFSTLAAVFPGVKLVGVQTPGLEELDTLLALVSHPNCQGYLGRNGIGAQAAWALGQPNRYVFYAGANPLWDAPDGGNTYLFDRNRFTGEEFLPAFTASVSYWKGKLQ